MNYGILLGPCKVSLQWNKSDCSLSIKNTTLYLFLLKDEKPSWHLSRFFWVSVLRSSVVSFFAKQQQLPSLWYQQMHHSLISCHIISSVTSTCDESYKNSPEILCNLFLPGISESQPVLFPGTAANKMPGPHPPLFGVCISGVGRTHSKSSFRE